MSTPAKTVNNSEGTFSLFKECLTPGRAFAAAHPHTELTIKTALLLLATFSETSFEVVKLLKPIEVNSYFIGLTISDGYIQINFE